MSTTKRHQEEVEDTEDACANKKNCTEKEELHATKMAAWKAKLPMVDRVLETNEPTGVLALNDVVLKSICAHRDHMESIGYRYFYEHDRSLFEVFLRNNFQPVMMTQPNTISDEVLHALKDMLREIKDGSKPQLGMISMLVMHAPKYMQSVADLVRVVQSRYSVPEDLDLIWDLCERLWCFGHPVYTCTTSRDLDLVCNRIDQRSMEIDSKGARDSAAQIVSVSYQHSGACEEEKATVRASC